MGTNPEKSPIPLPQLLPMLPPMPILIGDAKSVKPKPMLMLQPGTTDITDTDTHITDTDTPVIMVSTLLITVSAIELRSSSTMLILKLCTHFLIFKEDAT